MAWQEKVRVREAYDQLAANYDEAYNDSKDLAENDYLAAVARGFKGNVLDLGSGTGLYLELLPDTAPHRYIGLDISPGMLAKARAKFPAFTFYEADMEADWPVGRASVDAVVSFFGSFNYSLCPTITVGHLARALRPGGRFLIVLYAERWPTRHSYVEGFDGRHLLYTTRTAKALFDTEDFQYVRVRGLSRWVDLVRNAAPGLARAVLGLEMRSFLRAFPDQAYFLVVEGQRV